MPRYTFTGDHETVLLGLSHGVNAKLHRSKHEQPDGSTVVVRPGDEITTDEPYENAQLELVDGRRTARAAAAKKPAKRTVKKAAPRRAATPDPEPEPEPAEATTETLTDDAQEQSR